MKVFSNTGSIVGSNSSSVFSNRQAFPNLIQFSRGFKNTPAPSFNYKILKPYASFFSLSLIQLTAYN